MKLCVALLCLVLLLAGCDSTSSSSENVSNAACDFTAGELLLTEVMAAPVGEGGAEWIELFNTSQRPLQLNRAVLTVKGEGEPKQYFVAIDKTLQPKTYSVISNVNTPFSVVVLKSLTLNNSRGEISLSCQGRVADQISYDNDMSSIAIGESASREIVEDSLLSNKPVSSQSWCSGYDTYDVAGNRGTPGAANPVCGCVDERGIRRKPVLPLEGEIRITEVLADPAGEDHGKEWIELQNYTSHAIDMSGMRLKVISDKTGNSRFWEFSKRECHAVSSNSIVLVSNVTSSLSFGTALVAPGEDLYNDNGTLELLLDDKLVDRVAYSKPQSNVSFIREAMDSSQSNTAMCFSKAFTFYDGLGSPGALNEPCGNVCWSAENSWQPVVAPEAGQIVFTELYSNPEGDDNYRDWVELFNRSTHTVSLNGLTLSHIKDESSLKEFAIESSTCLVIEPNRYFIVSGKNASTDGVLPDHVVSSLDFYSSVGGTLLLNSAEGTIDLAKPIKSASGQSAQLTVGAHLASPDDNDNSALWCLGGESSAGFSGKGTPGKDNSQCP